MNYEDIFKNMKMSSGCRRWKFFEKILTQKGPIKVRILEHINRLNYRYYCSFLLRNKTRDSFRSLKIISNVPAGDQNLFLAKWILTRMEKSILAQRETFSPLFWYNKLQVYEISFPILTSELGCPGQQNRKFSILTSLRVDSDLVESRESVNKIASKWRKNETQLQKICEIHLPQ